MKILVTGSSGLIGSEAVMYYSKQGHDVFGIDNNMRRFFFGEKGDTTWNLKRMQRELTGFMHHDIDIRNYPALESLFQQNRFDVIIHCAAQPSHDKARDIPLVDFGVNATGTINLLEATRKYCPDSVFIYMSTNKVYGDAPNELPLKELYTRWEYADPKNYNGIDESCRIDRCLHSLFGASKLAGDVVAQEYGKYFGMRVGIFRGGCLTGPQHSGVELHGFLSYLVKCAVNKISYTVYGYKGKQVRDNIHSKDVITAFDAFIEHPFCGEVYNLGGGRDNSISIIEAISLIEDMTESRIDWNYVDMNRKGDHICYISDLTKFKKHFPHWDISMSVEDTIREIVDFEQGSKKTYSISAEMDYQSIGQETTL